MTGGTRSSLGRLLEEDPADLYENAPCGYLSTLPDGRIVKVNRTFGAWTGHSTEQLLGARLQDLLSVGGQVFYETHVAPLLRMQGAVREIAVDIVRVDGSLLPCLLNAVEVRDDDGAPQLVRATLFEATARRRYERELLAAQRAAEESEERMRLLHQAVSELARVTTAEEVAAALVTHGRAALGGRGGALFLVEPHEAAEEPALRVAASVGIPQPLLTELQQAAASRLALELAQGVRSVPLTDRLWALQPGVAGAMAEAGMTSLVVAPVTADVERVGVLVVGRGMSGDLISLAETDGPAELTPAETDLLWTLGRQAAQALERAQLHEQTLRQAERAAFLVEAARLLASASDVAETVERLAALAVDRLADLCVIDLVAEQGLTRRAVRHRDPALQSLADELEMLPPPALADRPSVPGSELADVVTVPLITEDRRLGVLTLGAGRRRGPFTQADVEVAEQLAVQVALVVAKAQRYELDVHASHELQANLLPPPPPAVAGLAVAVRYLAATHGVEVGGDFHDVVELAGGGLALAVGDVVGHDITAAATMGQLTSVYRALLVDGPSPSAVIDRLQAAWPMLGLQRMATALFCTLEPASGRLRAASAGHLPPLVLSGGAASYLPVRPSRLLGAPLAPAPALEYAGVLPVGATLVLFTDGLVESRTADLDEGLASLLAVAESAATDEPDELCDRLLGALTGAHRADDIALLALTRLG
jgi:serine/threonine-protein kinase RsbW